MEPSTNSEVNSSNIHHWLQERLIGNDTLSVFKLPRITDTMLLKKNPPLNLTVDKNARNSQRATTEARPNTPTRKIIATYEADCTSDTSNVIYPSPKSSDTDLPAFVTSTPSTTHEVLQALSTVCTSTSRMETTQPEGNETEDNPTCFRITNTQHTPNSAQSSNFYAGGKNSKNRHCLSSIQNCHPKILQGARFQHLSSVDALLRKKSELTRGSPAVGVQLDYFSPSVLSTTNRFMKKLSSDNTRITVSLPDMSDSTEQQLITVFFEISKLHGCDFSVDRKGTTLENEVNADYLLPSPHIPVISQQDVSEVSVNQKRSRKTTDTKHRAAPSHSTLLNLRALQSRLHSFGTHLVAQPQQIQPLQFQVDNCPREAVQGDAGDSDSSLPMYPEVIMNSSP